MRSLLPLILVIATGCNGNGLFGLFGGNGARTGQCDFEILDMQGLPAEATEGGTPVTVETIPLFGADEMVLEDNTIHARFTMTGDPCGGGRVDEVRIGVQWSDVMGSYWGSEWQNDLGTYLDWSAEDPSGPQDLSYDGIAWDGSDTNPVIQVTQGSLNFGVDETATIDVDLRLPQGRPAEGDWIRISIVSPIGWKGDPGTGYPDHAGLPEDLPAAAPDYVSP